MKYKEEWEMLVNIGQEEGLIEEQILLLLALREIADGEKGNEFKILPVQGTSLEVQAKFLASTIKQDTKCYQARLLAFGPGNPGTFVSFFVGAGAGMVEEKINQIKEELNCGLNSIDEMG